MDTWIVRFRFCAVGVLNCGEYVCGIIGFHPYTTSKKVIGTNFNIFLFLFGKTIVNCSTFYQTEVLSIKFKRPLWQVAQMQQMFKFRKKCQDKLPSRTIRQENLHFDLSALLMESCTLWSGIYLHNFCAEIRMKCLCARNKMHFNKEISLKLSNWGNPEVTKTHSQFMQRTIYASNTLHQRNVFHLHWGNQICCCWKL